MHDVCVKPILPFEQMQTEYSDEIAAARSLQHIVYLCTSMAAFWTYDYVCSLHDEWTFLLRSRWTKVKCLYIITRYPPLIILAIYLYEFFTPNENPDKCEMSIYIHSFFGIILVACSEFFFVLRTYALWSNNRIVLAAMVFAYLAGLVASTVVGFMTVGTSQITTITIPGITGCYRTSTSLIFTQFIFLFAFQLGLISLTLIRVMQSWQTTNGPLYAILVKHNIFYYASGLFLSAVNVLISMLFINSPYNSLLEDFECLILAILATRMHLHLWHMDRDAHSTDALGMVCLSDMDPADLRAYSASFVESDLN